MNLKIEKNIPIPPRRGSGIAAILREMQVGDSVLFPRGDGRNARSTFGRFEPKKFCTRSVDGGIRVWRIE